MDCSGAEEERRGRGGDAVLWRRRGGVRSGDGGQGEEG